MKNRLEISVSSLLTSLTLNDKGCLIRLFAADRSVSCVCPAARLSTYSVA